MLQDLFTQTLTIESQVLMGDIDDYGNPLPVTTLVQVQGLIQEQSRKETEGYIATGVYMAFLPPGTLVQPLDSIYDDVDSYSVSGPPANVWNPRLLTYSHVEATIIKNVGSLEVGS